MHDRAAILNTPSLFGVWGVGGEGWGVWEGEGLGGRKSGVGGTVLITHDRHVEDVCRRTCTYILNMRWSAYILNRQLHPQQAHG